MKPLRSLYVRAMFCALLYAPAYIVAQEKPAEPAQTIRVRVERVNVGAIVTGADGKFVEGLRREDFRVFDNGVEQPLTGFAAIEEPAQVLLLIEAGPAVYLLESGHVWAANALLNGLAPNDRIAVVKYAEAPHAILDFTSDKAAAAGSLDQLRFNLGFGSLNLSSSLSTVLDWLSKVEGKKTIVLLSTGVDTSAADESARLLKQLKTSDVRLLAVSLTGGLRDAPAKGKKKGRTAAPTQSAEQFEQADQLLRRLAEATGGRGYFPANAKAFDSVYAEIAQLVRHEYSLAFAPSARDGLVHSIEVRVVGSSTPTTNASASAYRVDHRQAYLAPGPK